MCLSDPSCCSVAGEWCNEAMCLPLEKMLPPSARSPKPHFARSFLKFHFFLEFFATVSHVLPVSRHECVFGCSIHFSSIIVNMTPSHVLPLLKRVAGAVVTSLSSWTQKSQLLRDQSVTEDRGSRAWFSAQYQSDDPMCHSHRNGLKIPLNYLRDSRVTASLRPTLTY
jgi:hypothetical protein